MRDIGWGWEFLVGIGMIAFWALVVLGAVWLIRGGTGGATPPHRPAPPAEGPLDILDRRLASGELTLADYRELRDAIQHDGTGAETSV